MFAGDGTEYAAPVVHDAFPGFVQAPEGDGRKWNEVRAIVTPDELFIYGERTNRFGARAPVTVLRVPVAKMRPEGRRWILTDGDGGEWIVAPGTGCGCGSPLRYLPSPIPAEFPTDD